MRRLKKTPGRNPLHTETRLQLCAVAAVVAAGFAIWGIAELLELFGHPLAGWPWRIYFPGWTNTTIASAADVRAYYSTELYMLIAAVAAPAIGAAWLVWSNTDPEDIKPALVQGQKRDNAALAKALKELD